MALQRNCCTVLKNLPYKLQYPTLSSSCWKQTDKTCTNKTVISRNFNAFHFLGAIGSKDSILSNEYNDCTKASLRACAVFHPKRHFFTSSCLWEMKQESNQKDNSNDKKLAFHEGMALRLVNENGFLSWCRNSYISTVAGLGMINGSDIFMAQAAGFGVLLIASMNMIWGSGSHISNLIRLRKTIDITRPTLFLHVSGAAFHALLYVFLLLVYLGSFELQRRGQWQRKKGDFEGKGQPWRNYGDSDHQGGGFNRRKQEKPSDEADKL